MRTTPGIKAADARLSEPFTIEATLEVEDRIAAARFSYAGIFEAARRRILYFLILFLIAILAMIYHSAWTESRGAGFNVFLDRFGGELFGFGGLPLLVIGLPVLFAYLVQPAMVARRLRRWYRAEGLDRPLPQSYRFEPGGVVARGPGYLGALGCRRVAGLGETPSHLFIRPRDVEDVFVLRRDKLSAEELQRIRAWAASCHVDGAGAQEGLSLQETETVEEPLLSVRFVTEEADRAAAIAWPMERPGFVRQRRRAFAIGFLLVPLLPAALCCIAWLLDPDRVPARYAFPLLLEMFTGVFWPWILGLWIALAAFAALQPWLRRRYAASVARQLHQRAQAYEFEIQVYADRLDIRQLGLLNRYEWSGLARIERCGSLLILHRRVGGEPLMLPQRAFPGEAQARFERMVTDGINEANQGGEITS
jgi:hypothetical protein